MNSLSLFLFLLTVPQQSKRLSAPAIALRSKSMTSELEEMGGSRAAGVQELSISSCSFSRPTLSLPPAPKHVASGI